eukprot:6484270-Amphidinium_carterae.1
MRKSAGGDGGERQLYICAYVPPSCQPSLTIAEVADDKSEQIKRTNEQNQFATLAQVSVVTHLRAAEGQRQEKGCAHQTKMSRPPTGTPLPNLILNPGGAPNPPPPGLGCAIRSKFGRSWVFCPHTCGFGSEFVGFGVDVILGVFGDGMAKGGIDSVTETQGLLLDMSMQSV